MDISSEINALKKKLAAIKDRRTSLRSELALKQKYLDEAKKKLKKQLEDGEIEYNDLSEATEKMETRLKTKLAEIQAKIDAIS